MAQKRDIEGQRLHRFELSDQNRTVRWVLIIILLVIAAIAITTALTKALETPTGWQSIQASSGGLNCSHEFGLQYDIGAGDMPASEERKAINALYSELTTKAWLIFYCEAVENDVVGIRKLNSSPNAELTVDAALYQALEQITAEGNRSVYFGPVYAAYDNLFQSDDAVTAQNNDPTTDAVTREYVQTLADFAGDPQHVSLELRGENRVFLQVSSEYLQFLADNGVERILDFGWLRSAFVIDYMAQQLENAGFTNGYLFGVDGCIRNLDTRPASFTMNVFMEDKLAVLMEYSSGTSIVALRSYPLYEENQGNYYTFQDGRTVSAMIDLTDGQSKCATPDLVAYAADKSCAQLAMSVAPVYISDSLTEEAMDSLIQQGINTLWKEGSTVCYTQQDLKFTLNNSALNAQCKN